MGKANAVKPTGRSLGMRQALRKTPSQPPPANPGWYTVSPIAPSIPITAAKGFQVSPGVDVGKAGSVRQAISAGNVVADAAQVLADIAGSGATMSPGAAMAGVTKVATALGMASVLLQKSTGVGTIRGKGMNGIGGAFAHRRAIASQDANRRRAEARANPYGNGSAGKRTSLADITAMVNDPSIVGLQLVSPVKNKRGYTKVGARCPALIFRPSTVFFAPRAARSCHCRRRRAPRPGPARPAHSLSVVGPIFAIHFSIQKPSHIVVAAGSRSLRAPRSRRARVPAPHQL